MLTQSEWEKLNKLSMYIHKEKNPAALRTFFLQELMLLVDYNLAEFTIGSFHNNKTPKLSDAIVVSTYDKSFEENFENQYENVFAPFDYVNWIFSSTESIVYRESDLINPKIREKSPFYKYYLQPLGLIHVAGMIICSDEKFLASVAIYRSQKKGDFTDRDLFILEQFLPHLQIVFEENPQFSKKADDMPSYLLKNRYRLTEREIQVTHYIHKGFSNSEIACELGISLNTVKKHIYNIFQKLEVSSRAQLISFLNELGFHQV